jgi:hypothetical protein
LAENNCVFQFSVATDPAGQFRCISVPLSFPFRIT